MSLRITYDCECAGCGATLSGTAGEMGEAGWRKVISPGVPLDPSVWATEYGEDCICKECYAKYIKLKAARDKADEEMRAAAGKFTPTPSEQGGSGTESDPYTFAENTACVVNAFYTHGGKLYVYMPADAESHAYASWKDAEADFAAWEEA